SGAFIPSRGKLHHYPKYFEGIVVEVVCYEGSLLWIFAPPLDKFSTFGRLADFRSFWGGRRERR
ncbi:MAG: hypothetical protein WBP95_19590, partial [Acidobacteriaceae bacterium]